MLRKITSLTSFFSFIVLIITSVVLYCVPQGRVAYWSMWTFLGLSKEQWGDIHITSGALFLVMAIIHIWLNWKIITAYLTDKARKFNFKSPSVLISILLTLFVTFGTLAGLPPMRQVLQFASYLKTQGEIKYGNPPYGHAELSPLSLFCKRTGLDLQAALSTLKKNNVKVTSPAETIIEISTKNWMTPKDLHKLILKDQPEIDQTMQHPGDKMGETHTMPGMRSGTGLGKMTLEAYCTRYKIDLNMALQKLSTAGAEVDKTATIREITGKLGMSSPMEIAKLLHP